MFEKEVSLGHLCLCVSAQLMYDDHEVLHLYQRIHLLSWSVFVL